MKHIPAKAHSVVVGLMVAGMVCVFYVERAMAFSVVARCGASSGTGYYYRNELSGQKQSGWEKDGISSGKIILINDNDKWDIQFSDTIGQSGYVNDGAKVILLGQKGGKITIGAFHNNYSDNYTFDLLEDTVVWTSHKWDTPIKKVAIYIAKCK